MSDQTLQLDDGSNSFWMSVPVFGYKTYIVLPFDIVQQSNGLYSIYDAGSDYDVRYCDCEFVLDSNDQSQFNDFMSDSSKGRADATITMTFQNSGCGFHPFGPDKGDDGPFTVTLTVLERMGVGYDPWLYFKNRVRIVNQDTYPAYTPPTEVSDGTITVDTITNMRFPPQWFSPDYKYKSEMSLGMNGVALFLDRSTNADYYRHNARWVCNESKAAALLARLVNTTRADSFNITTASNQYAFGYDKGSSGTYTARLIQNKIIVSHIAYDQFAFDLALSWEATA